MQEIHHKFGVTEKANYEIQLFVEDLIKKDRAEQLIIQRVTQRSELLKEIFNLTAGAWDDPVISEELYNRMEKEISFNCG